MSAIGHVVVEYQPWILSERCCWRDVLVVSLRIGIAKNRSAFNKAVTVLEPYETVIDIER